MGHWRVAVWALCAAILLVGALLLNDNIHHSEVVMEEGSAATTPVSAKNTETSPTLQEGIQIRSKMRKSAFKTFREGIASELRTKNSIVHQQKLATSRKLRREHRSEVKAQRKDIADTMKVKKKAEKQLQHDDWIKERGTKVSHKASAALKELAHMRSKKGLQQVNRKVAGSLKSADTAATSSFKTLVGMTEQGVKKRAKTKREKKKRQAKAKKKKQKKMTREKAFKQIKESSAEQTVKIKEVKLKKKRAKVKEAERARKKAEQTQKTGEKVSKRKAAQHHLLTTAQAADKEEKDLQQVAAAAERSTKHAQEVKTKEKRQKAGERRAKMKELKTQLGVDSKPSKIAAGQ